MYTKDANRWDEGCHLSSGIIFRWITKMANMFYVNWNLWYVTLGVVIFHAYGLYMVVFFCCCCNFVFVFLFSICPCSLKLNHCGFSMLSLRIHEWSICFINWSINYWQYVHEQLSNNCYANFNWFLI